MHGARGAPRLAFRLGLLGFSIAMCVLLAEIVIRLAYSRPQYTQASMHRKSDDPVLLYELKPDAAVEIWGTTVRTNHLGFRGENPGNEKHVVAVLGDSVAFGWFVSDHEVFSYRLGEILNRNRKPLARVGVRNFAVGGYNTAQELEVLKRSVLPAKPDLVLLTYCMNDLEEFTGDHVRYFYPPLLEVVYYSKRAFEKIRMRLSGLDYHHFMFDAYGWKLDRDFRRLKRLADKSGVRVIVIVVPLFQWDTDDYPYEDLHGKIADSAARHGLPLVDLLPSFRDNGGATGADLYHPNAHGHSHIAEALAPIVEAELDTKSSLE